MISEVENKYVVFSLGEEYYGIPIDNVLSIEKAGEITRVPNTSEYVKGVINLRGEVVPLIDLRMRLNIELKEYDQNSRVIVVSMEDIIVGLVVDASSEVLEIANENIDSPPKTDNDGDEGFVSGVGKVDDKLVILLKLTTVLEY